MKALIGSTFLEMFVSGRFRLLSRYWITFGNIIGHDRFLCVATNCQLRKSLVDNEVGLSRSC